jgi:GH24 family phage-related lysozyme (muramidase)
MRQAVMGGWVLFSTDFESDLDWFYLDVFGWVTIGLGLLADPYPLVHAMGLEFYWPSTGTEACTADVESAYRAVKAAKKLAGGGGKAFRYVKGNEIRATRESLARAAQRKLLQNEVLVRKFFPAWDSFPAAGQLLIMSMTWAMGAEKWHEWPHFCARVNAGDWSAVDVPHDDRNSCLMSEAHQNESFQRRNLASRELARRAAAAVASGNLDELDVAEVLHAAHLAQQAA